MVRVTGLTGEGGKLLCDYEADLPREDGTLTTEVPKKAAAGAAKNPDDI